MTEPGNSGLLGFAVQLFEARSVEELERAFDGMAAAGMQAVTVNPEGLAFQARELIAKLALARRHGRRRDEFCAINTGA